MSNVPTGVTTTFVANTKAKSAEVNTNFTDVKNWHSTFTYDLKNGTVYLQTSAKSADYVVLDTDGFHTILVTTAGTNRTITLPTATDNNGRIIAVKKVDSGTGFVIVDGEGAETVEGSTTVTLTEQYERVQLQCDGTTWHVLNRTAQTSAIDIKNYILAASVGSSALTLTLQTKAGNTPSASDPVAIAFRNATAATGDYSIANAVAATTLVISSGSTLGHVSTEPAYIYVYAINNAGTVELAASSKLFDQNSVQTSTTEGGAGAADSATTLYSTTGRTSKAIRLLARLSSTQTTAGTWAAVPTEMTLTDKAVSASGFMPVDQAADYSANTRMGLKTYLHGTNYSGGNAPTITLSSGGGTLSSVYRGVFIPYQMADGTWRCKFNVGVILSSTTRTFAILAVAGITFKTVSEGQAIAGWSANNPTPQQAYVANSAGTIHLNHSSASTNAYHWSGDVELDSKPTWAY